MTNEQCVKIIDRANKEFSKFGKIKLHQSKQIDRSVSCDRTQTENKINLPGYLLYTHYA
jgi:hypothetical protein